MYMLLIAKSQIKSAKNKIISLIMYYSDIIHIECMYMCSS